MIPPTALLSIAGSLVGALPPLGPLASGSHAIDVSTWGALEWVVYSAMALVCVWVLWRAVRTTIEPGEDAPDHVKRSILDDDTTPFGRTATPATAPAAPAAPFAPAGTSASHDAAPSRRPQGSR